MILIDTNALMISSSLAFLRSVTKSQDEQDQHVRIEILRPVILNVLRSYRKTHHAKYGELVLALDGKGTNWRKYVFPHYKFKRKEDRDKSSFDWTKFYTVVNQLLEELETRFPYQVIGVEGAEADDVIAICAKTFKKEQTLIVSSDRDFYQLQAYPHIHQYSPAMRSMVAEIDPMMALKLHIMEGDKSDSIPNFLSPDDAIANPMIRQTSLLKKKLEIWINQSPDVFCTDVTRRYYERNERLIDFRNIPNSVESAISDCINGGGVDVRARRRKMMSYFVEHRLTNLIDDIGDF